VQKTKWPHMAPFEACLLQISKSNSCFYHFYTWTHWYKSLCTNKQNPGFRVLFY